MRVFLIKISLYLLAHLPLPLIHTFATWLGQGLNKFPQLRLVQVTRINIQLCFPHWSPLIQAQLIKHSLIETCKTFSELGALWLWPSSKVLNLITQVSHEECLQTALQQGHGVILLTPHLGAWELAGLYASSHYPLTALYRPPKLTGLHELIHTARQRAGGHFLPTDQRGVRALYEALRRGEIVGILPDQVPGDMGTGTFADFFGIPAYTMTLVSRLARRTKAPVIFTYAERLPNGQGFHLHFLPAPPQIASDHLDYSVRALNEGIENCVLECLEQYQWSYKRFKVRPDGEVAVY